MLVSFISSRRSWLIGACASAVTATIALSAAADPSPDELAFFEGKVRPLLVKHCYECHSSEAEKVKGGLLLDSKEGWLAGGDSGDAIEPGKPGSSLVMETVRYSDPDLQMPPKYQLSEAEISVLEDWIAMGAPDPRSGTKTVKKSGIDWEQGRNHWAFQPVANPAPPTVKDPSWPRAKIDHFILSKIEAAGLKPAPDADRFALIRRVTLDLTGLPPTVQEVGDFVRDPGTDDEALAKVVDRLLALPAFGERWGRHWLDIARYADSVGKTRNVPFPHAWRYRNYVIDAFNADKPYNEFLTEQVAGDLLDPKDQRDREENIVATGLLALGSMDLNERDTEQFQLDRIDDQMDTLGRATMAITLGCARCHDHKFDPIAQKDYYAMAGIFASTATMTGQKNKQGGDKDYYNPELLVSLDAAGSASPTTATSRQESANTGEISKLTAQFRRLRAERKKLEKGDPKKLAEVKKEIFQTKQKLTALGVSELGVKPPTSAPAAPKPAKDAQLAMAAVEGRATDLALRVRGEPDIKGDTVPRAFPVIFKHGADLEIPTQGSGRLELAQWLTSPDHPLTARVMANRIWAHLLGRGIVDSVDNFGASGSSPSHPELLDHLATRFVQENWSVKSLIRSIVLSRTYRLSSTHIPANAAADESNALYWRSNLRRLEAEAIRDSLLAAGGVLESKRPAGAPFDASDTANLPKGNGRSKVADPVARPVRSVYLPIFRSRLPGMFTAFDFAEPDQVNGQRDVTTVATQALFLLNNPFAIDVSKRAAERILAQELPDEKSRIRFAYAYALCRYPTDAETARALQFLSSGEDRESAWAALTQALYSAAEFRYIP